MFLSPQGLRSMLVPSTPGNSSSSTQWAILSFACPISEYPDNVVLDFISPTKLDVSSLMCPLMSAQKIEFLFLFDSVLQHGLCPTMYLCPLHEKPLQVPDSMCWVGFLKMI